VTLLAFWSLALGVLLYAALAVWRFRLSDGAPVLAVALAGMSLWSGMTLSDQPLLALSAVPIRDGGWALYLWLTSRPREGVAAQRWLRGLGLAMAALTLLRFGIALELANSLPRLGGGVVPAGEEGVALVRLAADLLFTVSALVLVHNLYFASSHASSGFQLILFALGVLWAYDLNIAAATLLNYPFAASLAVSRGAVSLFLAPLFGLAARRRERWRIALSRRATFQSLSLIALGAYFVVIVLVGRASSWLGPSAAYAAMVLGAFTISALTVGLLFSTHARGWLKVFISKHLFEHRYDYRAEWLRFSATINGVGGGALTPEERAVKAVADVVEAPSGALYLAGPNEGLALTANWHWSHHRLPERLTVGTQRFHAMELTGRIIVLDEERDERPDGTRPLILDDQAWVIVPLVRFRYLVGVALLARPALSRRLDWEDFDLLKVLGQQIASYLADAQNQAELEEARRFEEFNRRFAFIIHDIKNVVSQLSLVAANAERHGSNPRFQADMASTLRNSVDKMNALLKRLSPGQGPREAALRRVNARALLDELALRRRAQRSIEVAAEPDLWLRADADALKEALDHLVQNAVEASEPDAPVRLEATAEGEEAVLAVVDRGQGMSPDFIRKHLFKPFASSKLDGFGIGAGEARALVHAMGGTLDVESTEGTGTRFTVRLARADAAEAIHAG